MWRKENTVSCWWDCKLAQALWKTVWSLLKKLKNRTTIWPRYSSHAYLSKKKKKNPKPIARKDICTLVFFEALFTISKTCKQLKCPSVDEQIEKLWYIQAYLRAVAGSVPDHCNKANITIKQDTWILWSHSAYESYIGIILWSIEYAIALCLKEYMP